MKWSVFLLHLYVYDYICKLLLPCLSSDHAHSPVNGDARYLYAWIDHEKQDSQRACCNFDYHSRSQSDPSSDKTIKQVSFSSMSPHMFLVWQPCTLLLPSWAPQIFSFCRTRKQQKPQHWKIPPDVLFQVDGLPANVNPCNFTTSVRLYHSLNSVVPLRYCRICFVAFQNNLVALTIAWLSWLTT